MTFKLNSKLFGSLVRAELYDSGVKIQDQYLSSKTQTDREEILKYGVKFDPFSEIQQNSASDWCNSLKERVINLFQEDNDFYKIQLISDNIFPTAVEGDNSSDSIENINLSEDTIRENLGKTVNATLSGRTLYKDGGYNTICLPFSLSERQVLESPLGNVKILYLSNFTFDEETGGVTITLSYTKSIKAGFPYFIRWELTNDYVDDDQHNLVNPTFNKVRITASSPIARTVNNIITPIGTYSPVVINGQEYLYMGANNTFYYPHQPVTIGSFRLYFKLNGFTAGNFSGIETAFDSSYSNQEMSVYENSSIDFFQSVIYDSNEYTIIDLPEGIDKVCLFDKDTEYPYGNVMVEFNSIEKQCEKILIITLSPNPLNEIINISSQIYKNQEEPHRNKNDYFVRNSQLTKDFYRVNNKQTLEDRENQVGIGQGDPESYSYQIGNLAIDPISHVILGTERKNFPPILFQKFYNKRKINNQFQWDKNTEYSLGDQVFCCGQIWISTIDGNLGLHPQLSPFWKIFSEESQEINLSKRDLPELEKEGEEETEGDEDQSQENNLPSYFKLYHSSNIEIDIDEAEVFGGVGYFKYRGTSNIGRFVLSDNEIQISTSRNLNEGYIEATVSNLQPGKYYTITIYEN